MARKEAPHAGIDALLQAAAIKDEELLIQLKSFKVEQEIKDLERDILSLSVAGNPQSTSTPVRVYKTSIKPTSGSKHSPSTTLPNTTNVDLASALKCIADACSSKNKSLPLQEPSVFRGDAFTFTPWLHSFKVLVEARYEQPVDRLYYLGRYTAGKGKDPIKGLLLLDTAEAYEKALSVLTDRFGNKLKLAQGFRQRIADWPPVRSGLEVQEFSDFLNQCQGAMSSLGQLKVLDDPIEQEKIIAKLPRNMQVRWYSYVDGWQRGSVNSTRHSTVFKEETPGFEELCSFVEKEARVLSFPLLERQSNRDTSDRPKLGKKSLATNSGDLGTGMAESQPQGYKVSISCAHCTGGHTLDLCEEFKKMPLNERVNFVKVKGLCLGCLKWGHRKRECRGKHSCAVCQLPHPTVLHDFNFRRPNVNNNSQASATSRCTENIKQSYAHQYCHSLIMPVFLSYRDKPQEHTLVYALLDDQSDTSFITNSVLERLQVQGEDTRLKLATILGEEVVDCRRVEGLMVTGMKESKSINLPLVYSRATIPASPCQIPRPETAKGWSHLQHVARELSPYLPDVEIGLLIGTNCPLALRPVEIATGGDNDPYGLRTALGWGIIGSMDASCTDCQDNTDVHFANKTRAKELLSPEQVLNLFDQDFSDTQPKGGDVKMSQEDHRFLSIVQSGISQCEDGHFQLPLPVKEDELVLPNNRPAALKRLTQLKSKMRRNLNFRSDYVTFMKELMSSGYAERVPDDELHAANGSIWYLPHHGIYHNHKPGKIRVVFDASAEYQGEVLNRHLLQGPDLINSLIGVLLRFRKENVALTCDIKKMFYQVRVEPSSRNLLRFLWFDNDDPEAEVVDYRMVVHAFGAKSSPSCANYALKTMAEVYRPKYGDVVADFIKDDFYVDDGLKSVGTVQEAIDLAQKSTAMCAEGGFKLCQFQSNKKEVLKSIPMDNLSKNVATIDLNMCDSTPKVERALGIVWRVESDTLHFSIELCDQPLTRRGILSTVSSVFDPLGLVSPFIFQGKKILQELCRNADWDAPVPEECRARWEKWRGELIDLAKVEVPRSYKQELVEIKTVELHHFADASSEGYGGCSYLKLTDVNDKVNISLVMAKSRVAPSKMVTIPRLELTAAVLAVKMSSLLTRELKYSELENIFYTDSKVVLGYVANESRRFHVFVANRVQQIRDVTVVNQWRHVPTNCNPADMTSRGMSADQLAACDLWWNGPEFLSSNKINSPPEGDVFELRDNDPEVKVIPHVVHKVNAVPFVPGGSMTDRFRQFSSWFKLKRVVALCLKYLRRLKDGKGACDTKLDSKQLQEAEEKIFIVMQREADLKGSVSLKPLDPFVDSKGIMRVGGRLRRTSAPFEVKHPVLIPRGNYVGKLILAHYHAKVSHSGRGMTMNAVRQAGYWVVNARSAVAKLIMNCVICRKLRGHPCEQRMSDLPVDRVEAEAPFTYSAVDYFGPFLVKSGRSEVKRWGVVYTCLSMRAIHIETANQLTTDSFLNSYRRFVCRRGPTKLLRCDRGTNFVGGKNELEAALKEMDQDRIRAALLKDDCDWVNFKMNFPVSSHMGGVWERMIGTVRPVLSSLLLQNGNKLDDELLRTLLCEVEQIVNSRPLTYVDSVSADLEPLSPMQILTLKSKVVKALPGVFVRQDIYCRRRWRCVQELANQFWERWRNEFLSSRQCRKKWHDIKRNMKVGDIVLLIEDSSRCDWPLGRVIEVVPSTDGLIRKVVLISKGKRWERPVSKLILLIEAE